VPAVLFDSIADYPRGYRVLSNPFHSLKRVALAIGMPIELTQAECAARWRKQRKQLKPLPLRAVSEGPILENVLRGEDVDLLRLTDDPNEAVRIIKAYQRSHRAKATATEPGTKPIRKSDVKKPTSKAEHAES